MYPLIAAAEDAPADALIDAVEATGIAAAPWLAILVIAATALVLDRVLRWLVTRWWGRKVRPAGADAANIDLARSKAQRTRLSVVRSLVSYVVFGLAGLAIVTLASEGTVPAAIGVSVAIMIVGLGLNRIFQDLVSGMMLLFERQYRVGDYIIIPNHQAAGVVEEFTLRTTIIRAFNGDRIMVLNGNIEQVVKVEHGFRDFEVEFFVPTGDLEQARSRVQRVCARLRGYHRNLFLKGPELVGCNTLEGRRVSHLTIRAVVPPTLEWLAEDTLPAQLELELGKQIVGPVQVFNLDSAAFDRYLHQVILPRFQAHESEAIGDIPYIEATGLTGRIPVVPPVADQR